MHKNTVPADMSEATVDADFVVLGSIDVERGPIADLAVTADGTTVVATHYGDGCISLIDAYALTVDADIDTAAVEPHLVTAASRRAYVTISGHQYDSVAVIDTVNKQIIANYQVDGVVTDVAVSPDGTRIFAGLAGDRLGLAVVNTFGRTNTIDLADGAGRTVDAVRVSPNGRFVYVATSDADSGKVLVVDAAKGATIREVPIASPIRDLALSRDGALAYVASFHPHWGGSVDVIDTAINEITAKVGIGGAPMQMALSARRRPSLHRRLRVRRRAVHRDQLGHRQADRHRRTVHASRSARTARGSTSPTTQAPSRSCPLRWMRAKRRPSS